MTGMDKFSMPLNSLRRSDCFVHELPGSEIALKGSGGPTCLPRPSGENAIRIALKVLEEFKDNGQASAAVHISVATTFVIAILSKREATFRQQLDFLIHSLNLKSEVMDTFAMPVKKLAPGAWPADRLYKQDT